MTINLDILKEIRETIEYIKAKVLEVRDANQKAKLNKLIDDIADLISNKLIYINSLEQAKLSGDKSRIQSSINQALLIAEADTAKLLHDLEETGLKASDLSIKLKTRLDFLANLKLTEVERLSVLAANGNSSDVNLVIEALASFQPKWLEIGNDLEQLRAV